MLIKARFQIPPGAMLGPEVDGRRLVVEVDFLILEFRALAS